MTPDEIFKQLVDEFTASTAHKALRDFVRALLKNRQSLDDEHLVRALKLIERVLN